MGRRPMTRVSVPLSALPWLAVTGVLVAGVLWRDCVLIASSALLAVHAFGLRMDAGSPWSGWRAAIRCWTMGVVAMAAGLALWAMVGAAWLDWWTPANDRPAAALLLLAAAAAACRVCRVRAPDSDFRVLADLVVPVAVAAALIARARGWEAAPCVFAALVAAGVGYAGWRLARDAGDMWAADGRR